MHELAIAEAVLAVAARHAGGARITAVHVRVGHLRQVVPDALAFSFELAACGTAAEGAVLELEEVPIAGACRRCGVESDQPGLPLRCPACGAMEIDVLRGEELVVDSLELEHVQTTRSGGRR